MNELTFRNDEWELQQAILSQDIELTLTIDRDFGVTRIELYLAEVIFADKAGERREPAKGWLIGALKEWVGDNQGLLHQRWLDRARHAA